jgi:thiamine biosynthesis lipoprotein
MSTETPPRTTGARLVRTAVLLGVTIAAVLVARRFSDVPAPPSAFEGATMGTTYRVLLGRTVNDATRRLLQHGVDSVLADVNARMSTYDPASELSVLNASADTGPFVLSAPLATVVERSLAIFAASGGRFDITVGPLVGAWGFGPAPRPASSLPDGVLDSLRAFTGSQWLAFDGTRLVKRDARVQLDLSAVAKGYAVDVVSDWLLATGEPSHLVEVGGELRARGRNAAGEVFRVGIEEPDPTSRRARFVIGLQDRAIATSGNYRNVLEFDGVLMSHTIDPVSGRPVRHRLLAASVLHAQCADADAWATALMVAGPDSAWALAQRANLDVALLIAGATGELEERMSDGFRAALLTPPARSAVP